MGDIGCWRSTKATLSCEDSGKGQRASRCEVWVIGRSHHRFEMRSRPALTVILSLSQINHTNAKIRKLMTSVGEKLKQRRQSLCLTQQQVADQLGVTVTTVKNSEAGRYIPKLYLEQTKALCDLLKLSLDDLVD
ncbi:helix-turn-helix transcriptional regulator [Microseira sp. BLCC-F43]|uniref:helix-turn-helix transcriptional regulator n=1 Tax=Microseira sp. BLCC-F43 TaxID=3153602 RepID=UPI0035BC5780